MVRLSRKALDAAMLTTGMNVIDVARGSSINHNTIAGYLRSGGNVRYGTAFKLAQALGVSPFDLVEDSGGADDGDDRHAHARSYRAIDRKGDRKD